MIRRLKKDVQKELPEKLRSKVPMEIPANLMREIKAKMALMQNTTLPEDAEDDENTVRLPVSKFICFAAETKSLDDEPIVQTHW